ncbi:predicted protein [Nematostella vectensis]|uniref:Uncharacterized protein n=1 Tax=Nematostella vectensis TaxID=45351 RepID=A7RFB5_NEMVE|nr:predicted protein [Nematostella vectensis]|eukprot:XP_001641990.1 predicted protein [Nematostella vectensis]
MERTEKSRKTSRPVSELITLFDFQEKDRQTEQRKSGPSKGKVSLKLEKNILPATQSKQARESEEKTQKKSGGDTQADEMITITLRPQKSEKEVDASSERAPKDNKVRKSKIKTEELKVPKALEREVGHAKTSKKDESKEECGTIDDCVERKKLPIDSSLAELRREMHSLRKQDLELMSQLLALNSSIQNFKLEKSTSLSDLSDVSEADTIATTNTDTTMQSYDDRATKWSLGSDGSEYDESNSSVRTRPEGKQQVWQNRESLGSEVSGYYSYSASPYGSDSSLNGVDSCIEDTENDNSLPSNYQFYAGNDVNPQLYVPDPINMHTGNKHSLPVYSGSNCALPSNYHYGSDHMRYGVESPRSLSPDINHSRQRSWPRREPLQSNEKTGSDPSLCTRYRQDILPVHNNSQSYYVHDEARNKRRMYANKSRRHSAMTITSGGYQSSSSLSCSGSDYSLYGNDASSDENGRATPPQRMQKWQRSKSTTNLASPRGTSPTIQRTIRVDLRKNVPAIELVLPIQPVKRASNVRMAETRPLDRMNGMSTMRGMNDEETLKGIMRVYSSWLSLHGPSAIRMRICWLS